LPQPFLQTLDKWGFKGPRGNRDDTDFMAGKVTCHGRAREAIAPFVDA
jgi:hypothetical protein